MPIFSKIKSLVQNKGSLEIDNSKKNSNQILTNDKKYFHYTLDYRIGTCYQKPKAQWKYPIKQIISLIT